MKNDFCLLLFFKESECIPTMNNKVNSIFTYGICSNAHSRYKTQFDGVKKFSRTFADILILIASDHSHSIL